MATRGLPLMRVSRPKWFNYQAGVYSHRHQTNSGLDSFALISKVLGSHLGGERGRHGRSLGQCYDRQRG